MALPKLNDSPKHELVIPSTGQKVRFRPYLVKEEKVLMIAFESGDQKQALGAIVDTIESCLDEDISVRTLTSFDIEYMFTQIRSKSVGETSNILLACNACEHKNEVAIDVSEIKIDMPEVSNVIELTPSISIEMHYPSYQSIIDTDLEGSEMEVGFSMAINCISAILTEEERIDAKESSKKELTEFVESMTAEQFKMISDYMRLMPALQHVVEFDCENCGEHNSVTLKGMQDFLS
jgi:DNA-directed RNA polymerase subunit M/transcription elongation factor TFIIS